MGWEHRRRSRDCKPPRAGLRPVPRRMSGQSDPVASISAMKQVLAKEEALFEAIATALAE